jgi:hypothetical protein
MIEDEALYRRERATPRPASGRPGSSGDVVPARPRTGAVYPEGDLPEPDPEREAEVARRMDAIAPRVARMVEHFLDRLRRRRGRLVLRVPRMGEIEIHRDFLNWAARNHRFIIGGVLCWYP